jgi:hypothetical protein
MVAHAEAPAQLTDPQQLTGARQRRAFGIVHAEILQ